MCRFMAVLYAVLAALLLAGCRQQQPAGGATVSSRTAVTENATAASSPIADIPDIQSGIQQSDDGGIVLDDPEEEGGQQRGSSSTGNSSAESTSSTDMPSGGESSTASLDFDDRDSYIRVPA